MAKQQTGGERHWYAIHTYSGYENAVARNLRQRIDSLGMQDRIFDVVAHRLKHEYKVDCIYESVNINFARWVYSDDEKAMTEFKRKAHDHLALDAANTLLYLAPTRVNLSMAEERHPKITFCSTREH